MSAAAETVLRELVNQKGLKIKRFLRDRLRASFIWNRANLLSGTLTGSTLSARVQGEDSLVSGFLDAQLGADRKSGPLVPALGGSGDINPNHLDLQDLSRTKVSDLAVDISDSTSMLAAHLRYVAQVATQERIDRTEMIVWRAAYLHPELWSPPNTAPTLNTAGLAEILNRRLRAVERMAFNVSSNQEMLGLEETQPIDRKLWNLDSATKNSNWFDGLRVRLFEYPYAPHYVEDAIPVEQLPDFLNEWAEQEGLAGIGSAASRLEYRILRTAQRTYLDGSPTQLVQAAVAWRFRDAETAWKVSIGATDPVFGTAGYPLSYRIDLLSAGPGSAAIDAAFDYTSLTPDGKPIRADFWNRAWLLCDHVIPLIFLEALLFALRRLRGIPTGTSEFDQLASRRSTVAVRKSNTSTVEGPVETAFVALDKNHYVAGPPSKDILMASQGLSPDGQLKDKYFENTLIDIDNLQVGDHVIIGNNLLYTAFSSGGEWAFENALVMSVDSNVESASTGRNRLKLGALELQGHGTSRLNHDDFRQLMSDIFKPSFYEALERIGKKIRLALDAGSPVPLEAVVENTRALAISWAPFGTGHRIVLPSGDQLPSAPWWFYVFAGNPLAGGTVEQALQRIPKSVGGGMLSRGPGDPTMHPLPITSSFPPQNFTAQNFFDSHVLLPLFEPVIRVRTSDRNPWSVYFKRAKLGLPVPTLFRPIKVDASLVPGLTFRGARAPVGVVRPRISGGQ